MIDLNIDDILHAPVRLSIMAVLAEIGERDRISYPRLQELLDLTSHLRKLETAGFAQTKKFVKRTPVTEIRLTRRGRLGLETYVEQLRAFVAKVDQAKESGSAQ